MKKYLLLILVAAVTGCMQSETDQAPAEAEMHDQSDATADEPSDHGSMDDADASAKRAELEQAMAIGLQIEDHNVGEGTEAVAGDSVVVHYTGWLFDESMPSNKGDKFDSSVDRGQPFPFNLGAGQVIKGWDLGVEGMKEGGNRTITIPSELGYGQRGIGPIPPNATLVFDVELLEVVKRK